MKLSTYLKNRQVFESRYPQCIDEFGKAYIDCVLKGFRNQRVFFFIYSYDRRLHLSSIVSSIDKHKRYTCRDRTGSMVKVENLQHSMIDRYSDVFDKALSLALKEIKR